MQSQLQIGQKQPRPEHPQLDWTEMCEVIAAIGDDFNLTMTEKVLKISKLVDSGTFEYKWIRKFLVTTPRFLDLYLTYEDRNEFKAAPNAHSAKHWSMAELTFYNIKFIDADQWSELIEPKNLTPRGLEFLMKCDSLTPSSCLNMTLEKIGQTEDSFTKACYFECLDKEHEIRIDDVIYELLNGVLDPKTFIVKTQRRFDLKVNKKIKNARPDIYAIHIPTAIFGIIFGEDKIHNPGKRTEGEAQAVAQAIAICQQEVWKKWKGKYIYFFRVRGFYVTFYRAFFDVSFLDLLARGERRHEPQVIDRYPQQLSYGDSGLCIIDPNQRKTIVEILCSIEGLVKSLY